MTTQPELPEVASLPSRPALRLAPAPPAPDVDFDAFVRAYEARLRRLVVRRIGDLCEAEEITQETLLRAYQHRASFGSEDELMAWSTVVAQRLVIDRVRVRGRSVAVADVPEGARLGRDTADIVVARHEARAALESLEAIPTRQAAILWAREVEGLHYEEIAERFGISEPAVRSLLHRGRKALRKEFKDRTGSLPLGGLVPFAPWLLALKGVGRLRGAAKAVAKSSTAAAVALSVGLVVAGGIAGVITRSHPPAVHVAIGPNGAADVMSGYASAALAGAAVNAATVGFDPREAAGSATSTSGRGALTRYVPKIDRQKCLPSRATGVCLTAKSDDEQTDATIGVDTGIPDAPGVATSTDYVRCDQTPLPESGPVYCKQQKHRDPSGGGGLPDLPPLPPAPSEGALR